MTNQDYKTEKPRGKKWRCPTNMNLVSTVKCVPLNEDLELVEKRLFLLLAPSIFPKWITFRLVVN